MKNLVRKICIWIMEKYCGISVVTIPKTVLRLVPAASVICNKLDRKPNSGEWKQHLAMGLLVKSGAKRKDAALAIELALRGIK